MTKHSKQDLSDRSSGFKLTSDGKCDDDNQESSRRLGGFLVLLFASISLGMLWVSFPPVGFSWLAWVAPVPMVWLVMARSLPARRPYWQLFFAGLFYWMATFYFIPIPHPALWVGWFAISSYMAIYTPMVVAISRTMVHRFRIPALIAVPVVWTGIEAFRCQFLSGMAMACLSHTQYQHPMMIQVADLFGATTLTFAIVTVATGIAVATSGFSFRFLGSAQLSTSNQTPTRRSAILSACIAIGTLIAVLAYGQFRLNEPLQYKSESKLSIGLIQTSNDVVFAQLSDEQNDAQFEKRQELTWRARQQWGDLDLIVWPEGGFGQYFDLISDINDEYTAEDVANRTTQIWSGATGFPQQFSSSIPLLTGVLTLDPENDNAFNAAILISTNGRVMNRYFKNHLVMFGEYIPLANSIPLINQFSPISGMTFGTEFENITLNGVNIAPSICFESTVPRLIRRQINTLAVAGTEPDVMINMTNDGWFFGTSCLDLHLACNVFRAVEMRKPHLVCANTGFSAVIDSCGQILDIGPRRAPGILRADVQPIIRSSLYRRWGSFIPVLFGWISLFVGVFEIVKRRMEQTK